MAVYYLLPYLANVIIGIVLTIFLAIYVAGDQKVTTKVLAQVVLIIVAQFSAIKLLVFFLPDSPLIFVLAVLVTYFLITKIFNPPLPIALIFTFFFVVFGKVVEYLLAPGLTDILAGFIY